MTASDVEAAQIDKGGAGPGWSRTGETFRVYRDLTGNAQTGVCRFYGTPGIGPNPHFYTVDPGECAKTQLDPGWTLETTSGFIASAPYLNNERPQSWDCGSGKLLYRLYNERFAQGDSNHRYVSDSGLYQSIQSKGWEPEGPRLCMFH
jgi:serine protease